MHKPASSRRLVIAVDGPAASGKGTLAQKLAEHFHLPHLDTGLLYRAVGYKVMQLEAKGTSSPREMLAIRAAQELHTSDMVEHDLGSEEIGQMASIVSAIPEVRDALLAYQRQFAAQPKGAVLDGRDIGTVICPDAQVKFFITASAEVRAERRYQQQRRFDREIRYEDILVAIRERDARDISRAAAPLKPAEDAIVLDTSSMNITEVLYAAITAVTDKFID